MKKFWKMPLYVAFGALMATGLTACSDNENHDGTQTGTLSEKETALKEAITPYVNNTVIATYKNLADATIDLCEKCEAIEQAFANGSLSTAQIQAAGQSWKDARKYWELSEAFLYGAAGDYNIDPHIDSWPLDKASMEAMLSNPQQMAQMSPDYVGNNLGYGLLGFHAIEYMLFQLNASETESQPRDISKFTQEETIYLSAIAGDLRNQCIRLEASWAGMDNVTSEKQNILTDAELEPRTGTQLQLWPKHVERRSCRQQICQLHRCRTGTHPRLHRHCRRSGPAENRSSGYRYVRGRQELHRISLQPQLHHRLCR